MAAQAILHKEKDVKGFILSVAVHAALLLFFLYSTLSRFIPKEETQKAEVYLEIEALQDAPADMETLTQDVEADRNLESTTSSNGAEAKEKSIPTAPSPAQVSNSKSSTSKSPATEKITTASSDVSIADAKAKAEKEKAEAASAKAREEARLKAEKDAKAKADAETNKKKFSGLFGSKPGDGAGGNEKEGSGGDPNANNLDGLVKGNGKIGEGLVGRGVVKVPKISDKSQKSGKVVVRVCVDKTGKVTEAKFTQKGSTTTDTHLVKIAEDGARKYQFSSSDVDKQCGTITIDFILN